MKVVCVIPAWNEEDKIATVIAEVKKFADEVVVVDDGSSDTTARIATDSQATVLQHIINRGQGAALQTGNDYALRAGADIIVHFDADGQFIASEIPEVIEPIANGECDVVFGSRFLGRQANMPASKRYLLIPLARLVNKIFFNVKLTDPQSGFRALSRSAVGAIEIEQSGWAHCSEILAKVVAHKLKFKEVPITVTYDKFGRSLGSGWQIIKDSIIAKLID
jgi:polyprenyl-phospho-N-acetylgalactosaminyl synthase